MSSLFVWSPRAAQVCFVSSSLPVYKHPLVAELFQSAWYAIAIARPVLLHRSCSVSAIYILPTLSQCRLYCRLQPPYRPQVLPHTPVARPLTASVSRQGPPPHSAPPRLLPRLDTSQLLLPATSTSSNTGAAALEPSRREEP